MVDRGVIDYLRNGLNMGHTIEQLKEHLIKSGFSNEVVDGAIFEINKPVVLDNASANLSSEAKPFDDFFANQSVSHQAKEPRVSEPQASQDRSVGGLKVSANKSGAGIKRRSLALVIIFSLFTFGIYPFYWVISTTLELRKTTKSAPSLWLIFTPMILMLLFFGVSILTWSFLGILTSDVSADSSFLESGGVSILILGLLLVVVLIIAITCGLLFYWKYSKAIHELNGFSAGLLFFLWLIMGIVAVILSQVELNKKAS